MFDLHLIYDQLLALDWTPFLLAVALGGAIGFEREVHGRPAGLRTHILVCVASALLIRASRQLPPDLGEELAAAKLVADPMRLAAGIVTGVGFLGAASVIRSGDRVRGVTTGACIWAVAALGVVLGYEAYGLAIASTILVVLVLVVLDWLEGGISGVVYRRLIVRSVEGAPSALADELCKTLRALKVRVQDVSGQATGTGEPFELILSVRCRRGVSAPEVLEKISARGDVTSVDWR